MRRLEDAVIDVLAEHGVEGDRRAGMPGVYVGGRQDRRDRACASRAAARYHGVALNADMDLAPFARIDPCGYPGLAATQPRRPGGA